MAQQQHRNDTELLLVITLLNFCRSVLGRREPAQAAMLQYVIADLVEREGP